MRREKERREGKKRKRAKEGAGKGRAHLLPIHPIRARHRTDSLRQARTHALTHPRCCLFARAHARIDLQLKVNLLSLFSLRGLTAWRACLLTLSCLSKR